MTDPQTTPQMPDEDRVWQDIYNHCYRGDGAQGFEMFRMYVDAKMLEASNATRETMIKDLEETLCQNKQ